MVLTCKAQLNLKLSIWVFIVKIDKAINTLLEEMIIFFLFDDYILRLQSIRVCSDCIRNYLQIGHKILEVKISLLFSQMLNVKKLHFGFKK